LIIYSLFIFSLLIIIHGCSDYGGWPETKSEMPMTFMTNKHRETIRQYCTRNPDNVDFPEYLPTSRNGEKEEEDFSDEEEEAGDEKWDLIEVIDEKSLKKKKPKSCDEEECQLGMSFFRELIYFAVS